MICFSNASEPGLNAGAFCLNSTEPVSWAEPPSKDAAEDPANRLQDLSEIVSTEWISSEAVRTALHATAMTLGHRITTRVRQRRPQDNRDFTSLRLLDCALDALEHGQRAYVTRQVRLAVSLYRSKCQR
jgi:hypothetical protein